MSNGDSNLIPRKLSMWFNEYISTFYGISNKLSRAVELKFEHTLRVIDNSLLLCENLKLDERITRLSSIIALLHDLGRFEQFQKYGTFADRVSVNHAQLAIDIIKKFDLLSSEKNEDLDLIVKAILLHNYRSLPTVLDTTERLLCNIIRDADKIDIYKIAADHYTNPNSEDKEIIEIGVVDSPEFSDEICEAVKKRENVDYAQIRTINDFKIAQIGWVYDFNFQHSLSLILLKGYYQKIISTLPKHPSIKQVIETVDMYLNNKLKTI